MEMSSTTQPQWAPSNYFKGALMQPSNPWKLSSFLQKRDLWSLSPDQRETCCSTRRSLRHGKRKRKLKWAERPNMRHSYENKALSCPWCSACQGSSFHPSSALAGAHRVFPVPAGGFGSIKDARDCSVTFSLGNILEFSALAPLSTDQTRNGTELP